MRQVPADRLDCRLLQEGGADLQLTLTLPAVTDRSWSLTARHQ
jgi:hypothetical protein